MRILWISHFVPYPPKGGMLLRSYNLLKELSKSCEIDLIALERTDTIKDMYDDPAEGLVEAKGALSDICADVRFVKTCIGSRSGGDYRTALRSLLPGSPYTVRWLSSTAFAESVNTAVNQASYDLVHYDTIGLAQYFRPLKGVPSVMNHHNIESDMLHRRAKRELNPAKKAYFLQEGWRLRGYERRMCRLFDLHITCSDIDSERLRGIDSSLSVETVPNGADIHYFAPAAGTAPSASLVFVGGQNWYPNRDAMEFFASEIWPTLRGGHPDLEFNLIGGSPSPNLLSLAERDRRFNVLGFVDEIRPYLRSAKVYVCPIRDGGGTKLKIVDALACGKAIVAHPHAVEGIDVTPETDVLIAETPEEFVSQTERLLVDDELRERIECAARDLAVAKYSVASIGARLAKMYSNLCDHAKEFGTVGRGDV